MAENLTKMKGKRNVYRRHLDNLIGKLTVLLEDINIKDEHDHIKLTTINNNIKTKTTRVRCRYFILRLHMKFIAFSLRILLFWLDHYG